MKNLNRFFLTLVAFTLSSISYAHNACGNIYAEWLYLQPSIDNPFFAVENRETVVGNSAIPFGKRFANKQDWKSAYRIGAYYNGFCGLGIEARWTHLPSCKQKRAVSNSMPTNSPGGTNFAIVGSPRVSVASDIDFHEFDFAVFTSIWRCCNWHLDIHGGIRYGRVEYKEELFAFEGGATGSTDHTLGKSRATGVGPLVGLSFDGPIWGCLSLNTNIHAALLISDTKARLRFIETAPGIIFENYLFDNDSYWRVIPAVDLQVGLDYNWPFTIGCRNFGVNVQGGYAFITYFRAVQRIRATGHPGNQGMSNDEYQNLLLHGPYVRLGFSF